MVIVVSVGMQIFKDDQTKFCDTVNPGQEGFLTEHSNLLCQKKGNCMPCPFEAVCENGEFVS